MGIEDWGLDIEGPLRNLPGLKRQIFLSLRGDLRLMELDLQSVYPNTLKKKVVWKIKLQKWHRRKTMEKKKTKLWKGMECLLLDRNVKQGGEELWTFIMLNSYFSVCLERVKLEDHLWTTVAEWKILCMTR